MSVKDVAEIFSNLANAPRIEELKKIMYDLQKENLDLKSELEDCKSKLKESQEWNKIVSLYKIYKTESNAVIYVKIEAGIPEIFYCPVCFCNHKIIPLQPIPSNKIFECPIIDNLTHRYCPSCDKILIVN